MTEQKPLRTPDFPDAPFAIAVSGGGDSLGLLSLAHEAAAGRFCVLTVDHGLRAESAEDAAHVAALCAERDIAVEILTLDWPDGPPTANVQAQARAARYDALIEACRRRGIGALLTAHHADDQAETLLMRLARGSGLSGLGGIRAARPLGGGVTLHRPCLHLRSADLRAAAAAAGLAVREDPSNRNPAHDRTRFRALLAATPELDPGRLADSAAHLAQAEAALDWAAGLAFDSRTRQTDAHSLAIDARDLPQELRRRLMIHSFAALGAAEPRGPELMRFIATLESGGTAQLGGLTGNGGPLWTLRRE